MRRTDFLSSIPRVQIVEAPGGKSYVQITSLPRVFEHLHERHALRRQEVIDCHSVLAECVSEMGIPLWAAIDEWIATHSSVCGLAKAGEHPEALSSDEIINEGRRLWAMSKDFPWSRLRSLSDKLIKSFIDHNLPATGSEDLWRKYEAALEAAGQYWFRRSVGDHLSTGFHTAISANFKMLGMAVEVLLRSDHNWEARGPLNRGEAYLRFEDPRRMQAHLDSALDLATYLSTTHMSFLHASDGLLWDSAGSNPSPFFVLLPKSDMMALDIDAIAELDMRLSGERLSGFTCANPPIWNLDFSRTGMVPGRIPQLLSAALSRGVPEPVTRTDVLYA
jgi:hypothetical protein